jgi:hypothetical protein
MSSTSRPISAAIAAASQSVRRSSANVSARR